MLLNRPFNLKRWVLLPPWKSLISRPLDLQGDFRAILTFEVASIFFYFFICLFLYGFHLVKAYLNIIYSNDLIWQWFPSLLLTFIARKFGAKKLFLFNKRALYKKNYQTTITNWIRQTIGGAYKEVLYLFDDGKIQDWNISLTAKCDLHFSISDIETRSTIYLSKKMTDSNSESTRETKL